MLVAIDDRWEWHRGFVHGACAEAVTGYLYVAQDSIRRDEFKNVVGPNWLASVLNDPDPQGYLTVEDVLGAIFALERMFKQPTPRSGRVISKRSEVNGVRCLVVLESFNRQRTTKILSYLKSCFEFLNSTKNLHVLKGAATQFISYVNSEKKRYSRAVNNARIIEVATELSIPYKFIDNDVVRVGSGRYSHLFKSTITQSTSSIGVANAASKLKTAQWLRRYFLPVPRKSVVSELEQAKNEAKKIGFPVAVKPDVGRQGLGVTAPVEDARDLAAAFEFAKQHDRRVIVEEFVRGRDYRITVERGKIIKAIERRPGSVIGDGVNTIEAILAKELSDFEAGIKEGQPVRLDDEARRLISLAGHDLKTVLAEGEEILLRRRANMSAGGKAYDVAPVLHPDNAELAIRATRALKLDLAGIDIISEDISKSWRETHAKILEVNAQPQISRQFVPDVYKNIIMSRLDGGTRAFVFLFVADEWNDAACRAYEEFTLKANEACHTVIEQRPTGIFQSGKWIAPPVGSGIDFVQKAEWDQEIDGIVACPSLIELERHGMPAQFVDRLVFHVSKTENLSAVVNSLKTLISKTALHLVNKEVEIHAADQHLADRVAVQCAELGVKIHCFGIHEAGDNSPGIESVQK